MSVTSLSPPTPYTALMSLLSVALASATAKSNSMILPDACRVNIQPARKACSISAESLLNLSGICAQFRRFGCAFSAEYAWGGFWSKDDGDGKLASCLFVKTVHTIRMILPPLAAYIIGERGGNVYPYCFSVRNLEIPFFIFSSWQCKHPDRSSPSLPCPSLPVLPDKLPTEHHPQCRWCQ